MIIHAESTSSGNYIGRVKRNNNNIKHSGDSASQQSSWQPTMNQDKETLTCNKVSTIQSQLIKFFTINGDTI